MLNRFKVRLWVWPIPEIVLIINKVMEVCVPYQYRDQFGNTDIILFFYTDQFGNTNIILFFYNDLATPILTKLELVHK